MIDATVTKAIGAFRLSAEIHDEGFICLSGKNGSGKSTLLKIIAGLLKPDTGSVKFGTTDVTRLSLERRGVVLVTPDSFIPHLGVDRHIRWGMRAKKLSHPESRISEVKGALGISFEGRVDRLSLGMRERVSLGTALLSEPMVLLVDEAFSNLDNKEATIRAFRGLCATRKTDVVFTTQTENEAGLADHHYSMEKGTSTRVF